MGIIPKDRVEKGYRHRAIGGHPLKPETLMMGYGYDPRLSEGAVKCPIFLTSTFAFRTAEEGKAFFEVAYGLRPGFADPRTPASSTRASTTPTSRSSRTA